MSSTHVIWAQTNDTTAGDGVPATGATPAPTALWDVRTGGALALGLVSVSELGSGFYKVAYTGSVRAACLLDFGTADVQEQYQTIEFPIADIVETLSQRFDSDHKVNIRIKDIDSGNPIPGATVVVRDANDLVTLALGTTDSGGIFDINLDNGSYVARVYYVGGYVFQTLNPFTITGTVGTTILVDIEGQAISSGLPAVPSNLALCTIFGYVVDLQNNAISGTAVSAEMVDNQPEAAGALTVSGAAVQDRPVIRTTTDVDGLWSLQVLKKVDLIRPASVRVRIPAAGIDVVVDVPDAQLARLDTLI